MSSSDEVYGMHLMPDRFEADILLPNGLFFTVPCNREDTLEHVKKQLWKMIGQSFARYFGFGDQSSFIFMAVTLDAKLEEFYEESRRLCDLRLFDLTLKLIEPAGNKEEKLLSCMIDLAIGKKINDLYLELPRELKDEVYDFRQQRSHAEHVLMGLSQGAIYSSYSKSVDVQFRLRVISATYVNVKNVDAISVKVAVYHGIDCIGLRDTKQVEPSNPKWDEWVLFDFNYGDLPRSAKLCLSICAISKRSNVKSFPLGWGNITLFDYRGYLKSGRYQLNLWPVPKGSEESIFPLGTIGSNPSTDTPCLMFEFYSFDQHVVFAPERDIRQYANHSERQDTICYVDLAIQSSDNQTSQSFQDSIYTVPNNYTSVKSSAIRERIPSRGGNDPFFDRRLSTSSNCTTTTMSHMDHSMHNFSSSRPPSVAATDKYSAPSSRTSSTSSMKVRHDISGPNQPSNSTTSHTQTSPTTLASTAASSSSPVPTTTPTPAATPPPTSLSPINQDSSFNLKKGDDMKVLNEILKSDPLIQLDPEQKKFIWSMRQQCRKMPDSLPRLLDAIDWKNRKQISQLYLLLKVWPAVGSETALRLLDIKYEDILVRRYAVRWLDDSLSEDQLSCYLLQLVQVLKTEPYLDNELSHFLIRRALSSPGIGNLLFWYLKSECDEINDFYNTIRFRYLLERYCRGLPEETLSVLVRQVKGLEKLMNLTVVLKEHKNDKETEKFLHKQIQRVDFAEMLRNIPDPTNHRRFLGEIVYDECRIMDSSKRPLWLVWSLPIVNGEMAERFDLNPKSEEDMVKYRASIGSIIPRKTIATSAIIFKNGDDLRQDMLTLQMIRIVDSIWRHERLDMCMLAYTCLATGKNVGIIEVVNRAETIMSIQRAGGRMAAIQIDPTPLHRWIKERNEDNYDEAIKRFTHSCAGFSVLTFVLGIADRNPDNIMVSEDGRIFHIDFGHFLGHFKKKFGINRERVPFVLIDDFLFVISRGSENCRKSDEFNEFRRLCGEAYITLRRHSSLLITLFTMMLRTGIPELKTLDDISYLKQTLQVGETEQKAHEYFQTQFFEAYVGNWTTKVDWFFHHVIRK